MTRKNGKKAEMSFEEAVSDLERIIARLERDELTLDESITLFEEGMKVMVICDKRLHAARGTLSELLRGDDGQYLEKKMGISLDSLIGETDFSDE